ncbi:hypothetical protein E2C01_101870 [Portunus trituberculatus]|uniref:Uncharacterized protein n=1 Tax=Portunus trituberculatus TaxID=210409 RepID=A0A5B7KMY5_PORTR|nr:hypothetical protein [Portunus trituberculatus]
MWIQETDLRNETPQRRTRRCERTHQDDHETEERRGEEKRGEERRGEARREGKTGVCLSVSDKRAAEAHNNKLFKIMEGRCFEWRSSLHLLFFALF